VSSTYFSPSGERGRTFTNVSTGSGSTSLSSFMSITAIVSPVSSSIAGLSSSTRPTRRPPTCTSLPFTRFDPPGSSAETS
jgi:hypothetical protein